MSLLRELRNVDGDGTRPAYSKLPFQGIAHPVFIIGCGRSGTTIFGTTLSKHKHVTYLNEPRHLWFSAYPETDIWTPRAYSRNGKLVLTAADAENQKSKKISQLFRFETIKTGRPVLIEKLPINNFRLNFIHQIFPDARFIHLYRNGLEVARSIQKMSERGSWFGTNSYKWNKLVEHALNRDASSDIPSLCSNYFEMGLLEWRLSTEAAVEFLKNLTDDVFFELNYDELTQNPVETISRVLAFIGLEDDHNVKNFAFEKIERRTSKLIPESLSDKDKMIGGSLLPLSMDGGKGLTNRCT